MVQKPINLLFLTHLKNIGTTWAFHDNILVFLLLVTYIYRFYAYNALTFH